MAKDVAPEMISFIQNRFQNSYQNSNTIQSLLRKLEAGTATYSEAYQYAQEVSKLTNSAYSKSVTSSTLPDGTMYYNIASRVIPETLEASYELVSSYSAQVQTSLNQSAGIGLKAKTASEDEDRISGIVDLASSAKNYSDVAQEVASTMENYTENIVDRTIEDNVDFQGSCGMTPKVTRIADSGCCEWCAALAGTYSYPTISRDVYRRHLNCHCTVIYDPGTGKVQNVHTKQWTDADEVDKIEARKKIGLRSLDSFNSKQYSKIISSYVNLDRSQVVSAAEEGGRHANFLKEAEQKTNKQLEKSIVSHTSQVERHADKISHPNQYILDWDDMPTFKKEGTLKVWQKDMRRNAEQAMIELSELERRTK